MTQAAYAERDGIKIAYEASGEGDPPLVFVHGWSCDRSYFQPQFDHFGGRHRVVSVDLRGHGESDQPEDGYGIESFADDVVAVSDAEGLGGPVVIGHSMGGLVALSMAARGAARAAVMVDPAPIILSSPQRDFFESFVPHCIADADGSYRARFVEGMFLPSDVARRDEIITGMASRPPRVAAAAVRGMIAFDGAGTLRRCEVPLLSIGSAVPSNSATKLREHCPTITIGQTVGSGHFNQLEVPSQVNAMIERFLEVNRLV